MLESLHIRVYWSDRPRAWQVHWQRHHLYSHPIHHNPSLLRDFICLWQYHLRKRGYFKYCMQWPNTCWWPLRSSWSWWFSHLFNRYGQISDIKLPSWNLHCDCQRNWRPFRSTSGKDGDIHVHLGWPLQPTWLCNSGCCSWKPIIHDHWHHKDVHASRQLGDYSKLLSSYVYIRYCRHHKCPRCNSHHSSWKDILVLVQFRLTSGRIIDRHNHGESIFNLHSHSNN